MTGLRESYDAIVVGAGIGGLTAASLLAKNKKSVLVLEQGSRPGGYCSSFEDRGCTFDVGLSYLLGCELGGGIYEILDELGLRDCIEFVRLRPAIRIIGNNYDVSVGSASDLADTLVGLFPMETPSIRQFMGECRAVADETNSLSKKLPDAMDPGSRTAFKLFSFLRYRRTWLYGRKSRQEVVEGFFRDPTLRVIVLSMLTHFDPGVMARLSMAELGTKEDFYYPKGGAQSLAEVLVDGLRRFKGELALGTRVDRIMVKDHRAWGVTLHDGRQIEARYVISDADAKRTYVNLVGEEHLKSRFKRKLELRPISRSGFIVSLGVSLNLKAMGFDGASIVYNPVDDIEELYGVDPSVCTLNINLPSINEPWRSWGSTTAVQIKAALPYNAVDDWASHQEEVADAMIKSAANVIPNLAKHVISKHIMSPPALEEATGNSQGAVLGWYPYPGKHRESHKTIIRNLYQVGQWSLPGGGVPSAFISGRNAARLVMKGK